MDKKAILGFMSIFAAFIFGACSATAASAEQTHPLKIWMQNENGAYNTLCVVDETTGVNYVVVSMNRNNTDYTIAITPRLNADGSIYASED